MSTWFAILSLFPKEPLTFWTLFALMSFWSFLCPIKALVKCVSHLLSFITNSYGILWVIILIPLLLHKLEYSICNRLNVGKLSRIGFSYFWLMFMISKLERCDTISICNWINPLNFIKCHLYVRYSSKN